jgi:hypothetical protein
VQEIVALLAPEPGAAAGLRLAELRRGGGVLAAHEELTRRIASFPSGAA